LGFCSIFFYLKFLNFLFVLINEKKIEKTEIKIKKTQIKIKKTKKKENHLFK